MRCGRGRSKVSRSWQWRMAPRMSAQSTTKPSLGMLAFQHHLTPLCGLAELVKGEMLKGGTCMTVDTLKRQLTLSGPKSSLSCTYPDCKRNNKNKGFGRRENLNEHIRRVHGKESQSQPTPMKRKRTDGTALGGTLEDAETPTSRGHSGSGLEHDDPLISPSHQPKRPQLDSTVGEASEMDPLRREHQELRLEHQQLHQDMRQFMQQMERQ